MPAASAAALSRISSPIYTTSLASNPSALIVFLRFLAFPNKLLPELIKSKISISLLIRNCLILSSELEETIPSL